MLIIIDHSGSPEQNKAAKKIKEIAEDDYGFTTQTSISSEKAKITLMDEDFKEIVSFDQIPEEYWIHFYLNNFYNEE
jgi:hypothetical protein